MNALSLVTVPTEREAIAPYNFVPLPEKIVPAEPTLSQDIYHASRHTGTITCTLTTASPLYVRCAYTQDDFASMGETPFHELTEQQQQLRAQFFHYGDLGKPVIPGSSLRGMLRALVEIASYGKMEKVTDMPRFFYRAVAAKMDDPLASPYRGQLRNVRAGYLTNRGGSWYIRPARTIGGETFLKVREQDIPPAIELVRLNDRNYSLQWLPISYTTKRLKPSPRNPQGRTVVDRIDNPDIYTDAGWLAASGNMLETGQQWQRSPRKNHVVVFDAGQGEVKIADTAVEDYINGLSNFQVEQLGPNGVLQDGRPVFYCEPPRGEREVIFFGHNPNFRLPFRFSNSERAATPLDFVPESLRNDAQIDLAEAMFGYVRRSKQDKEQALAGRIFVSDAKLALGQTDIWYSAEPITPPILASPKPTTFQHYLVQPKAERPLLKHYASKPGEETVVRGHKLYWHKGENPNISLSEGQKQISESQKTLIRPVKPGVNFTFDVRFENLSQVELGALVWVAQLAADEQYRLTLGMGKPLGMGAVKIESEIVLNDRKERYKELFSGDHWASGASTPLTIEDLEAQTSCIEAFQNYVVAESGDKTGNGNLRRNLRIQCLLALLRWPGPLPAMTRYLEIERDVRQGVIPAAEAKRGEVKVNEYKLRPVLPSPLQIIGELQGVDSALSQQQGVGISTRSPSQPVQTPPKDPPKPIVPTLPAVGDIITGQRARQVMTIRFKGERKKVVAITPNKTISYTLPQNTILEVYADDQITGGGFYGQVISIDDSEPRTLVLLVKREKRPPQ